MYHDDVIKWKLALCAGISPVPVNSPHKGSDAEFDVFFDLRLNKRLNKQS